MASRPPLSSSLCLVFVLATSGSVFAADAVELPNPFPRELIVSPASHRWDFEKGTDGWVARNDCAVSFQAGTLIVKSSGSDPYLAAPVAWKKVALWSK